MDRTDVRASRWPRRALIALCAVAALASVLFSLRTTWSLQLLRSAYAVGAPGVSNLRPWMTLRYVATTWRVPEAALIERLGLAGTTDPATDLKTLAERDGISRLDYVQRVQAVVAELAPRRAADRSAAPAGWLAAFTDRFLAGLLAYGYPVLGLTLMLGAIGVPLPAGLVAAMAGSLVAQGQMSGLGAGALAVTASVVGDVVGYGLGRMASEPFLQRWGRWIGYTPARRARVASLIDRYDVPTMLLSRTLVSSLSSVVNLLAGMGRHGLVRFVVLAVVGRLLWTSAYLGLGYGVGGDLEAATRFLQNLAGLLVALAVLTGTTVALRRRAAV
jgi:membrane protein DedA with SNARE-associated domain